VTVINLEISNLKGTIPTELGELQLLNSLYLNENTLSGPIPTQLGGIPTLTTLFDSHLLVLLLFKEFVCVIFLNHVFRLRFQH